MLEYTFTEWLLDQLAKAIVRWLLPILIEEGRRIGHDFAVVNFGHVQLMLGQLFHLNLKIEREGEKKNRIHEKKGKR